MGNLVGDSGDANVAGVVGSNSVNGVGIWGEARPNGRAIVGVSNEGTGVWGHVETGRAVVGVSKTGVSVWGHNASGRAIVGAVDDDGTGVWGEVKTGTGIVGLVQQGTGVGVSGRCDGGDGVRGTGRRGVVGISDTYQGVYGKSGDNAGVVGESDRMHAMFAVTHSPTSAGIYATNDAGGDAALFEGNVTVTGDLVLAGADIAEEFEIGVDGAGLPPGAVVALDDEGRLRLSDRPYDRRVVGIVSGGGDRVPALVLDRTRAGDSGARRVPLAIMGKAWCFADASSAPIGVGDLLTAAHRPGHAMRASTASEAFGALIGKALSPLLTGTGMVLVLVGLG